MWNTPVDSHSWLYVLLYGQLASFTAGQIRLLQPRRSAARLLLQIYQSAAAPSFMFKSDAKFGAATTARARSGVAYVT